ncbi:hypothetical protein K488DRAFT_84375 [Vararia minispora EC-137]|uniref:Uncharacterized protein n=1 Tax=Vararia minispora EC-137 TaxID=1314806 RepID=A0ACB8QQZ5_9AGAM|nr:hypothetical protein K488DRAFT_84375 [Vararia minispora EC-137]
MASIGYPPGWIAIENPMVHVRQQIENVFFESLDGSDANFLIFAGNDEEALDLSLFRNQTVAQNIDALAHDGSQAARRWARYPDTWFSSEALPVYPLSLYGSSAVSPLPYSDPPPPPPPSSPPPPLPSSPPPPLLPPLSSLPSPLPPQALHIDPLGELYAQVHTSYPSETRGCTREQDEADMDMSDSD